MGDSFSFVVSSTFQSPSLVQLTLIPVQRPRPRSSRAPHSFQAAEHGTLQDPAGLDEPLLQLVYARSPHAEGLRSTWQDPPFVGVHFQQLPPQRLVSSKVASPQRRTSTV